MLRTFYTYGLVAIELDEQVTMVDTYRCVLTFTPGCGLSGFQQGPRVHYMCSMSFDP